MSLEPPFTVLEFSLLQDGLFLSLDRVYKVFIPVLRIVQKTVVINRD